MTQPYLTPDQEATFSRLLPIVASAARRLVTMPRAADFDRDDAQQTGAIALCQAIRDHDPSRGPLEPWCRLAVRNAIVDAFRQSCGREPGSVRRKLAGAATISDDMGSTESADDCSEVSDSVQAALDWMEPLERKIVELHYLESMKLEDVGEAINMSVSRVCQIANRAIERLREIAHELPAGWRLASRAGAYRVVGGGGVQVRVFGEGRRDDDGDRVVCSGPDTAVDDSALDERVRTGVAA